MDRSELLNGTHMELHVTNTANHDLEAPDSHNPEFPITKIRQPSKSNRMVKRNLSWLAIFMITINGTIGSTLYWSGGKILAVGGPLSVLVSFLLAGLLAWAVMQCISEMLCIWPVPGALSVFVAEFVDHDLGKVVGFAYWFSYAISYNALLSVAAEETRFWVQNSAVEDELEAGLMYVAIPILLIFINSMPVKIYGWIEIIFGGIKLAFLFIITVALFAFAVTRESYDRNHGGDGHSLWENQSHQIDEEATGNNRPIAFLMCISMAVYAYVGVEIVAGSALEAKPSSQPAETSLMTSLSGITMRFSAVWTSAFLTFAYTLAGLLMTFSVGYNDCQIPRLAWLGNRDCDTRISSAFVLIPFNRGWEKLADAFNLFLVFSALSCANTNLYVASRAMFGLANQHNRRGLFYRVLSWFGKTTHGVPSRAVWFSALIFCWFPFLSFINRGAGSEPSGPTDQQSVSGTAALSNVRGVSIFTDILSTMGTAAVVVVWACECLAYIRFHQCVKMHNAELKKDGLLPLREEDDAIYPYRSHLQPFMAYAALVGCIFAMLVAAGASIFKNFNIEPFLSSYLIVFLFILIWGGFKIFKGMSDRSNWNDDLQDYEKVRDIFKSLKVFSKLHSMEK